MTTAGRSRTALASSSTSSARFATEVGADFHLQMKISATDHDDAVAFFRRGPAGNTVDESVKVCQWLVEAGVDAIHVSTGSFFPHPMNPAGVDLPVEDLAKAVRHDDLQRRADVPRTICCFTATPLRSRGWPGTGRPAIPTRSRART